MKQLFFIFCIAASLTSAAQNGILYYRTMPPAFAFSRIAKSDLQKDMDFWQTTIEESHVNPYHAISKKDLVALKNKILEALPDSVTPAQCSFAISELIGSLDEGHLGFSSDPLSDSLYATEAIRFPYLLQDIEPGAFIVQRDLSNNSHQLAPFTRITAINGIDVQKLYEKYTRFNGGLAPWRKLMVRNGIRKLLYMDGIRSPFLIKTFDGKDTVEFTSIGYTPKQADSLNKVLLASAPPSLPFSLRFLENSIALIEFNSMDGRLRDSFSLFAARAFAQIKEKNATGLIIDLRKNGGGDSGLGDTLISYISGKSYRNASGMKMRISKHSKAFAVLLKNSDPFSSKPDGYLYEYKSSSLTKPGQRATRFNGKTCVLTGPGTFSSANMLTNAIKDYKLATLIGEPTAESPNDFGEMFNFMLPNTHIVVRGAMKMFIRANGDDKDFTGIQPDILAVSTQEDIGKKYDRALETAKQWILKE